MNQQPWALILGASSGFGEATAIELAARGMNIFGVHLDLRETLPHAKEVQEKIRSQGRDAVFFNLNAADEEKRRQTVAQIREVFERRPDRAGTAALARLRRPEAAHRRGGCRFETANRGNRRCDRTQVSFTG